MNYACPVGVIIPFLPGYFADGSNGTFAHAIVSDNTAAAVNAYLNSQGWYVCNGAVLDDMLSPIFNGAGRYLPNLTDDRFLMGDTVAGGIGGANSSNLAHTHTTGNFTLTSSHIPSHSHSISSDGSHTHAAYYWASGTTGPIDRTIVSGIRYTDSTTSTLTSGSIGSSGSHSHGGATGSTGSGSAHNHGATGSGGSGSQENRPSYLSCFYIMRVR
jgi:microcystin-dependent protein